MKYCKIWPNQGARRKDAKYSPKEYKSKGHSEKYKPENKTTQNCNGIKKNQSSRVSIPTPFPLYTKRFVCGLRTRQHTNRVLI